MLESDKEQINKALKNKPSDQVKKIICFIDDALTFNKKHNIFVRSSPGEILEKDILDCLPLIEKINTKEKILDLGSGGGFPGILLAILKPECEIHLLEKSQKKCYFLNKTKDSLNLMNMKVLKTTIQKNSPIGEYSLITARAFSSAKNILEISEKNLMKEGRYLLLKGKIDKINEELESINTNKYKCEIIKTENEKYERHLVEIKINE